VTGVVVDLTKTDRSGVFEREGSKSFDPSSLDHDEKINQPSTTLPTCGAFLDKRGLRWMR